MTDESSINTSFYPDNRDDSSDFRLVSRFIEKEDRGETTVLSVRKANKIPGS
jgi:hypothetical protein